MADGEVDSAVLWLNGTADLKLPADVVEDTPTRLVKTKYVPLGIAVGIVPWNCEYDLV